MRLVASIVVVAAGLTPAWAADLAEPVSTVGRYQLAPAGTGFIRLDTRTGETAACEPLDGVWVCDSLGADDALAGRVDALAAEVARLAEALKALPIPADDTAGRIEALSVTVQALGASVDALTGRVAGLVDAQTAPQVAAPQVTAPVVAESPPLPATEPEAIPVQIVEAPVISPAGDQVAEEGFVVEALRRLMALAAALRGEAPSA